jgi:hypothetical protein
MTDRHQCAHLYERFHVSLGARRTTISIDKTLSILMSLQLDKKPNTTAAHLALRQWLQAHLDRNGDERQARVSQWLQTKIAEALISGELKQKYADWHLSEWIKDYPSRPGELTQCDRSL